MTVKNISLIPMEKKYHVNYKKFMRVYLVYSLVFAFFPYLDNAPLFEIIVTTVIGTTIAIAITHVLFKKIFYDKWVITLMDDEVETFALSGKKKTTSYKELGGPYSLNWVIIRAYIYSHASDRKEFTILTDYMENIEECLEIIESKMES